MSAEIFPWRREHLDLLRVLNDLDAVLDVRRDGVGVAGTQLVSRVACKHTDATRENIAGLLVRMRVKRDYVLLSTVAQWPGDRRQHQMNFGAWLL